MMSKDSQPKEENPKGVIPEDKIPENIKVEDSARSVAYAKSKRVLDYMNKDVLVLDLDTLTRDATRMLQHYDTDDIVVTDKDKKPIGIVTDEDILTKVSDVNVYAENTRLKDLMSSPLITISGKATLQDALDTMKQHHIRKTPSNIKKKSR